MELGSLTITVLRFTNDEVLNGVERVLQKISEAASMLNRD